MQIFINESSLNSQYQNRYEYIQSIRVFVKALVVINEYQKDKTALRSHDFFYSSGLKGVVLDSVLKANPDVYRLFQENFQMANPKVWQKEQKHDNDSSYEFMEVDFSKTSTAELAERKLQENQLIGLLLNFSKSVFGDSEKIEINKNKSQKILIDCVVDESDISEWLVNNKLVNPNEKYDESSSIVPLDFQTVLNDSKIFEKTHYPKNKGRKVYRKKDNFQLWVVDSSSRHAGSRAHIEVFDAGGNHLGTSLYNKVELDVKYKKDNRTLNLG